MVRKALEMLLDAIAIECEKKHTASDELNNAITAARVILQMTSKPGRKAEDEKS
jgi:hypothetical protein